MPVTKGKGQMKDSGFSRPYGPFSAKEAKKIADAIEKGSTKKPSVTKKAAAKPMAKPAAKAPAKTITKAPAKATPKAKPLVGPAAVKAIQDRTSPAGVKKAEMDAKKAIDKKYPGLYKKSK